MMNNIREIYSDYLVSKAYRMPCSLCICNYNKIEQCSEDCRSAENMSEVMEINPNNYGSKDLFIDAFTEIFKRHSQACHLCNREKCYSCHKYSKLILRPRLLNNLIEFYEVNILMKIEEL